MPARLRNVWTSAAGDESRQQERHHEAERQRIVERREQRHRERREERDAAPRRQDVDPAMAQDHRIVIGRRVAEQPLQIAGAPRARAAAAAAEAVVDARIGRKRRSGGGAARRFVAHRRFAVAVRSGQRDGAQQRLRLQRARARAAGEPVAGDRRKHRLHVLRAAPSGVRTAAPTRARPRAAAARRAATARAGRRRRRRCRRCRASRRAAPARSRAAPARRARRRPRAAIRAASADRRAAGSVAICARRSPLTRSSRSAAGIGVADLDRHQEAVELRLGQRIGADLLDRILRGDDEEGIGQLARLAVLRHLPLLHRLHQRALRLRRRAVDLVGEHDRMEDRARVEAERRASRCRRSTRRARRRAGGRS